MNLFAMSHRLHEVGLLGMNGRNGDYISQVNVRKLYPLVDDKLLTKQIAQKAGLATPELYATFDVSAEIKLRARKTGQIPEFCGQAGQRQPRQWHYRRQRPDRR